MTGEVAKKEVGVGACGFRPRPQIFCRAQRATTFAVVTRACASGRRETHVLVAGGGA